MLLEDVEDLRHADDHRDSPPLDDADDVVRIEAAHEDDGAVHHRRDVGGHRLAEHVAERQQIEEAQRKKRPCVLLVLQYLALDRHDVGHHVAMPDDHALRFGRRPRREHDLGDVVTVDRDSRHRSVGGPVDVGEPPQVVVGRCSTQVHVVADHGDAGLDNRPHFLEELARGAVIDRHHDDARNDTTPVADDPFRPVFTPEHHLVALGEPGASQAGGESACRTCHLDIRVPPHAIAVVIDEKVAATAVEIAKQVDEGVAWHAKE